MEDFGVGRTAPATPPKAAPELKLRTTRQQLDGQTGGRQVDDGAAASNLAEALTPNQATLDKNRGLHGLLNRQPAKEEEKTSLEEVQESTTQMNQVVEGLEVDVRFRVSENDNGSVIVEVFDRDSGDVLRTIPPEEVQALRKRMQDVVGLVIDRVV